MPEDLAGLETIDTASAPEGDEPAAGVPDIEKIRQEAIAAAEAAFEERFKGLQRVIAEKDSVNSQLQRQLDEQKLAALDEEDREAELARREQAEIEKLRAEVELLRLAPEYGAELPLFQRLLAAPDAKAQLDLIREIRAAVAPAKEPDKGNPAPPPVDPNNPISSQPAGVYEGVPMTEEMAERLLRSSSRMRG